MKKLAFIISTLVLSSSFSQAQFTGTFHINGSIIIESSCEIKADNITLEPVTLDDIAIPFQETEWSNSNTAITFSNCSLDIGHTKPTASIEIDIPSGDPAVNDKYWNSKKENVGIELKIDGKTIPGSGTEQPIVSPEILNSDQVTTFKTQARVIRLAEGNITPGPISTTVNFNVKYK